MLQSKNLRVAVLLAALLSAVACGDIVSVQNQAEDGASSTTANTPTPTAGIAEQHPAIVYCREAEDETILVLADTEGNVLREVRDLPQHQYGPERFRVKVAVSPDGARAIYEDSGENRGKLFVRDLVSGEDQQIGEKNGALDTNPAWSPDGEWIAFERELDSHTEIFRVRPDGSEAQQLTDTEDGAGMPAWSPDSETIAFVSPPSWRALGYEVDADPAEFTPFAIHTVNADGSDQHAVPGAEVFEPQNFVPDEDPNAAQIWSPDSRRIVFTVYESHDDRDGASPRLAISDIERRTTDVIPEVDGMFPAWSPVGDEIAFARYDEEGISAVSLYDVNSGETALLNGVEGSPGGDRWSPDGEYMMYQTEDGIVVHDSAGGDPRLVAEQKAPWPPVHWVMYPDGQTDLREK